MRLRRTHLPVIVLLLLALAQGAAAAGSHVLTLHVGDHRPTSYGWEYSYWTPPYLVQERGLADDQGYAAWEIDDPTPFEALYYTRATDPWLGPDAREAGFTLRIRLRVPPQTAAVPPSDGMAGFGLDQGLQLLFGTNAAPPVGDGNLRVLAVGGPPEVVIPGGSIYHLVEAVYDPVAGNVDVFVDSVEVISDWAPALASNLVVRFGSILGGPGVGVMRTNLVELEVGIPDCEDGLDNDGDGFADEQDPGCTSAPDDSELDTFACNDGQDDDGDGLVDLADPGCASGRDEIEFDVGPDAAAWVAATQLEIEHRVLDQIVSTFDFQTVGVARLAVGGGDLHLQVPPVSGTAVTGDGALAADVSLPLGTLALSSGVAANTHPLYGAIRYCTIYPACDNVLPFQDGPHGLAGIGGELRQTTDPYGPLRTTLRFAPWTLGTASAQVGTASALTQTTRHGFLHGPLSATSTLSQTSGVVQLVTPMQLEFGVGAPSLWGFNFATLRVRLLPEPRAALLLGSGALLLLALGWRRAR